MSIQKSKEDLGSVSNTGASNTTATTTMPSIRQRMAQNYLLVWVDASIDQTNTDCQNTLTQLRAVINDVTMCSQSNECIEFLDKFKGEKAFVITSGSLGQHLVPEIHGMPNLDAIYILCGNISYHQQWTKDWNKIKGIHNNIKDICDALKGSVKQVNQDSIPISFLTGNETVSIENLNQLEPSYMYTQTFKDILLEMEHDREQAIKILTGYCRNLYSNNIKELKVIDEFKSNYRPEQAIRWYTRERFTYQMLNRAFRTLDADTIINMGFFIHDLHEQIDQLHQQQLPYCRSKPFTVYRGEGLLKTDFDKLKETKGGLMSFNNFLSTSAKRDVSLRSAEGALGNTDMVGILFIMTIDPRISSTLFASIKEVSYCKAEEEILFSMHTVFRIGAIKQMDNYDQLYEVELKLTADDDEQLRQLTECISNEARGSIGWRRLSKLLLKTGHFDKAEELYKALLEQTSNDSDKGYYYNQLGYIKDQQGEYKQAIGYYRKAVEIFEEIFPTDESSLATSYNNIGLVYSNMGEYSKALSYYEKALGIRENNLPENHPGLANSYNKIGNVYCNMEEYSKSLSFFEKTHEIFEKTLPVNHPDLATSYGNIGMVYNEMKEYSKALLLYEKALGIKEKTLPANHPDLATSYNNIGNVYNHMGDYSKAHSYYEKTREILEKIVPANLSHLATSYNNLGSLYNNMKAYLKALSFYEKALDIKEKTLPSKHLDFAQSYNNIGSVYSKMGEYSKALSFYEKVVGIREKALPPNHLSLTTSYSNIGLVYRNMGEYSNALSFYEKALEIREKTLPPNHPNFAESYNNIGTVHNNMGEFSKALLFYEKVVGIREKALPPNHPSLAASYNNIGSVYNNMGEYSKALLFYEKALEIREKTLSQNHPSLATSYKNISSVYSKMGEYSKAVLFYEKALEVKEIPLSAYHPYLPSSRKNVGLVQHKLGNYAKASGGCR
ncbi:unnamed protein product [Adineta steineri]|uniref:NAD(P)(+)--arginine ADP-ribosyltransferase n=1 Tax=Adineta steineri TaxID=433720 RepID=A0A813QTW9_9BILA|nr:unnamed protein product [Adineta steineri]CAF1471228.1 unnamed protein product [Adineta steineri]